MCTSLNKYLYVVLVFLSILFFKQKLSLFFNSHRLVLWKNVQGCFGWMEQGSGLNFSTLSSTEISLLWKTGLYYVTAWLPNTCAGSGQPSMHHWHQNPMRFDPKEGFERTSCFPSVFTNWTCLRRGRKKNRYRVLFDKLGKAVFFLQSFGCLLV